MRKKMILVCEVCGKESDDVIEMSEHESAHFGLSVSQMQEWANLDRIVKDKSANVYFTKNTQTEKELDDAVNNIIKFEEEHNLKGRRIPGMY